MAATPVALVTGLVDVKYGNYDLMLRLALGALTVRALPWRESKYLKTPRR